MIRPSKPAAWPLTDPKTPAAKKATELHAAWVKQFARVEKVEADHAQARADLVAAEAAIGNADTAKSSEAAEKAYAAAREAVAGPWDARLVGPVRGSEQAEAAFREHVTANLPAILSELDQGAEEAQAEVLATTEAQVAAFDRLGQVESDLRAVLTNAEQINARAIPSVGANAVTARRSSEALLADPGSVPVLRIGTRDLQERELRLGD